MTPEAATAWSRPPEEQEAEQEITEQDVEDVWSFLLSHPSSGESGGAIFGSGASRRRDVLEVHQVCGDTVMEHRHFPRGTPVTVGAQTTRKIAGVATLPRILSGLPLDVEESWKSSFFVPPDMVPAPDYALFVPEGDGWVLLREPAWKGFVEEDGVRTPFPEGALRVRVPTEGRLIVDLGGPIFVATPVVAARRLPVVGPQLDYPFVASVGLLAVIATLFGTVLAIVPPPPEAQMNLLDEERLVTLMRQEEKQDVAPEGARAKGAEGKPGEKEAEKPVAKGEKLKPMTRTQIDRTAADEAGLLAAIRENSALQETLGSTGMSAQMADAVGGLIGTVGTQVGSQGLGGRGGGVGGGGTVEGIGGLSTRGPGKGAPGLPDLGVKQTGTVGTDASIVVGQIDKALIDAVIKRNLQAIRYCYQRQLTKTPSLSGKVTVKFIIAKDGSVSSATTKSSSLGSPAAEGCINSQISRLTFPMPKGGGIVIVSYPFLFSSM